MKRYTVRDIAAKTHLSPATVSRVLNNFEGVREETRNIVYDAMRELEQDSQFAFSLPGGIQHGNVIGLILGDIRNPYYAEIAYTMQGLLNEKEYLLMQFNSSYDETKELNFMDSCEKLHFAGLIMISTLGTEKLKERINKLPFPVVLINRFIQDYVGPTVLQDNFQSGYIAASHLIELGFPEIAFIAGQKNSTASMKRLEGFQQALQNYYIPLEEKNVLYGELTLESGRSLGEMYLKDRANRPKAIVIGNDLMAIGFLDACDAAGVRIPADISVVSFDDIEFASLKRINLTTVRQPVKAMCKAAAEMMIHTLAQTPDLIDRVILEPELIVRATTDRYNKDV